MSGARLVAEEGRREGGGGGGRAQGTAAAWLVSPSARLRRARSLARTGTIGLNLNRVKLHKGAKRSRDPAESPKLPETRADPFLHPPLPSTPPSPARPGQGSPSSPLSPAPVRASNSVCACVCVCVRDPHPASPPPPTPPAGGTNSGACPLLLPGPSAEGSEGASGGHRSPTATHRPGE